MNQPTDGDASTPSSKSRINPYKLFLGSFLPNWLLERTEISAGAKLCYARLAQFAGKNGVAWPMQSTLADEIGVGERQVRRYVVELEDAGLIDTERVGFSKANRYHFLDHEWMRGDVRQDRTDMSGQEDISDRSDRSDMTCAKKRIKETESKKEVQPQQRGQAALVIRDRTGEDELAAEAWRVYHAASVTKGWPHAPIIQFIQEHLAEGVGSDILASVVSETTHPSFKNLEALLASRRRKLQNAFSGMQRLNEMIEAAQS